MPTGIVVRHVLTAVAAAVLLAGLSGCGGDPEQPATLPTQSTSSPAPTSASPPALTPEQEVEQFIRDYYTELTRAAQTQDIGRLSELSTRGCPCFVYVRAIRSSKRQGLSTPDAEWRAESIVIRDINTADAVVGVEQVLEPYDALNAAGNVVEHYPRQTALVEFSLVKIDNSWIIGNILRQDG